MKKLLLILMLIVTLPSMAQIKKYYNIESNNQCVKEELTTKECLITEEHRILLFVDLIKQEVYTRINHGAVEGFKIREVTHKGKYIKLYIEDPDVIHKRSDIKHIIINKNEKEFQIVYCGGLIFDCNP